MNHKTDTIILRFEGEHGPKGVSFVESENTEGASIKVGEWGEEDGGRWKTLTITIEDIEKALNPIRGYVTTTEGCYPITEGEAAKLYPEGELDEYDYDATAKWR